jgi:hypothetical protein
MLKLIIVFTIGFFSHHSLLGSELLPPSGNELSVVDPELEETEKLKENFLRSLQNEIYFFKGFNESRRIELENKFGLRGKNYSQEDIVKASMEWSRNNLTQYDSINEVHRINPPLSAHGKQSIIWMQNTLDSHDLNLIRFFDELSQDLRKPLSIGQSKEVKNISQAKGVKLSQGGPLIESSARADSNSSLKQHLIEYINSGIPALQTKFHKSEKLKMIKLVGKQTHVSEESIIFFKSMIKFLSMNKGSTEFEHIELLKRSLMVSGFQSLDKAILNLQRIYVIASRYSTLKSFDSLYRMQTHPSNSFVSYSNSQFSADYFNLSLIAGWFASANGKHSEALDQTMRTYLEFIQKTLNAEANIEEESLKRDLKKNNFDKALKNIVDMMEASKRMDVLIDIKFLMDSMFRSESMGRTIEFKLASAMLQDREFMIRFGSSFIEKILVRPYHYSGVIHKISNHANPNEVLSFIKRKIKTEYKWNEYGGPWSITDVEWKLSRFYNLHPVNLVKALGHNLNPLKLMDSTTKLLRTLKSGAQNQCRLSFKKSNKE